MVACGEKQFGTFVSQASLIYFVVWESTDRRFLTFAWLGIVGMMVVFGDRVAEVVRRHKGPSARSLDSDENF